MPSWTQPTPDLVKKAIILIRHDQHRRRFFERLQNPRWLRPLFENGLFKDPPTPIKNEDEGTIRFPPWPQSAFLARMAQQDPDTVCEIIKTLPDHGNILIHEDIADAALAIPPEQADWIVDLADDWLRSRHIWQLCEKLARVLLRFVNAGQFSSSLRLAETLLGVSPQAVHSSERESFALDPDKFIRIDPHQYVEIVRTCVPGLVVAAPHETLQLFCELLEKSARFSWPRANRDDKEDGSYDWCPSIAGCSPYGEADLRNALVATVRDSADRCPRENLTQLASIVALYDSKQSRIFERLGYHLLYSFPEHAMPLIGERLTDRSRFGVFSTRFEYEQLAEKCFGQLASADQQTILGWINEGPDTAAFADRMEKWHGQRPNKADLRRYSDGWRRDRLAPIKNDLSPEWSERYQRLVEKFGNTDRSPFHNTVVTTQRGRPSPLTYDDLRKKSVEELVVFLETWRPTSEFHDPSFDELVETLSKVISEDPGRFVENWERFKPLSPRYFYALLWGLQSAVPKQWSSTWWSRTHLACQWACGQPGALDATSDDRKDLADASWTWAARTVLSLISSGLQKHDATIPIELRSQTWTLLYPLTTHPDPSPDRERLAGADPYLHVLSLSLNSIRSQAIRAVVQYALWLRSEWEASDQTGKVRQGLDAMPEVREVLDRHLDLELDPSVAVRAAYGDRFPWICLLDKSWAKDRVGTLFPQRGGMEQYWTAAWFGYISHNQAYGDVFRIMKSVYSQAIEKLASNPPESKHSRDPARRLAEHVMVYYCLGLLSPDDDALVNFFGRAPEFARQRAIEFMGWSLGRKNASDWKEHVIKRLELLCERRIASARRPGMSHLRDPELVAFGSWIASSRFGATWSLQRLKDLLEICTWSEPCRKVVDFLAQNANEHLESVLECTELLVKGDVQGWVIHSKRDEFRQILRLGLTSHIDCVAKRARSAINALGRRGHFEFGDLLPHENQ